MEALGGLALVGALVTIIIEGAKKIGVSANVVYLVIALVGGAVGFILTSYANEAVIVSVLAVLGTANRIYEWLVKPMTK